MDKLTAYQHGDQPLPAKNKLWPLYGAGLENMGVNGQPIEAPMPTYGPDQLLIRHDACGLCFSDVKLLAQGQSHPRILKDMQTDPVIMGHEVSMTVIGVGEHLKGQYKPGDRLTLETDIFVKGVGLAYGYMLQGGLSQYSVLDDCVLHNDHGSALMPVTPDKGYAEIALTEPWACVVAAYRLEYRTGIKPGGTLWVIGAGDERSFSFSSGFDASSHPAHLLLSNVPAGLAGWLKGRAADYGVDVTEVPDISAPVGVALRTPEGVEFADDIVLLGNDPDVVEKVSPHLGMYGIMAIMATEPMPRRTKIDVGRIHYHRWLYVGTSTGTDISRAYRDVPVRSNLKPGGKVWFVGAGGPIGRMHVQRAIEFAGRPATIVCTDVSDMRLEDLCTSYSAQAKANGIELVCLNPLKKEEFAAGMQRFAEGFDDIVILAPIPAVIADAATHLAPYGVMNVFAGVVRGTETMLDLSAVYLKNVRIIGHSGSVMTDMRLTLDKVLSSELLTNRSVAAVGSLSAAYAGLQALKDATYPGKVVIYPNIKELPLTSLPELKEKLPSVYAKLANGREWTNAAEAEFLRVMLP
jgi:threonine dehydrogenase-like Zn-dependent dehydrogenase